MSAFTLKKETLSGVTYYSTFDAKGNCTTMFDMSGETFVMVNKSPARALCDIRKKSGSVKFLESVFGGNESKAANKKIEPLRIRLTKSHTTKEIENMMRELSEDPESKAGAIGLDIYNKSVMKKLDEMSWSVYYLNKSN